MFDVVFRGARVIDPLNGFDAVADVAVKDGKIALVAPKIEEAGAKEYDYTGQVLQPGIIDPHVHIGSMYGSHYGHRMLAMEGVTGCLDMAGPLNSILEESPEYGAGLNVAILEAAYPPETISCSEPDEKEINEFIDRALDGGAYGVKLLGGHFPVRPDISANFIRTAYEKGAYIAWHAGSTEHGSNIEGMLEAVDAAAGLPLHVAHINAYCRGAVMDCVEETKIALQKLRDNPNILCESYLSPKNGTRLTLDANDQVLSKVTASCLTRYGFTADRDGMKKAFLAQHASVNYDAGGYTALLTGQEGIDYWESQGTDVAGSFNVNPGIPRAWLAEAKREDGSFVVDAISTDGGVFTRNVILNNGLALVKMGIITLPEFVVKTSLNPARMLRMTQKGHFTPGADADITVFNFETQKPVAAFVAGEPILINGEVVGKSATIICTKRGQAAVEARGLKTIVVDPAVPYTNRFVLKH